MNRIMKIIADKVEQLGSLKVVDLLQLLRYI